MKLLENSRYTPYMSDSIQQLFDSVDEMRESPQSGSRTSKLMRDGTVKMAKKLAEEAVEVGHEAILGDRACVITESADLLYNLVVLWADAGVTPDEVWQEMERRRVMMGLAEKLPKVASR